MFASRSNATIIFSLLLAIFFWGGNNTATKFIVATWPPVWTGATRFLCAGLILLAVLRWTKWLGEYRRVPANMRAAMWWRGGLSLAAYVVAFNLAVRFTTVSHVALYLGTAPVWALVWEERPHWTRRSAQRYGAALLAVSGVVVLFWPALKTGASRLAGEALALAASVLWTNYGRQCRKLGGELSGAEISAHTMWRAGLWLLPVALWEVFSRGLELRTDLFVAQGFCVLAGGVAAFALWNNALGYWPTSQVFLFINLIPLSTMLWANVFLGEPFTRTFWLAMALIVSGVILGQAKWEKMFRGRWLPLE